jgi:rare lipoprotein A
MLPDISQARHHDAPAPANGPAADYPVTIGDPYVIGGVTYTPADTLNYDAVGYARAGSEGSGISGAHHTLPLPCYVEVTSIDSGRTILVRIDRRGPMGGKQLVELSPAAWAQLGLPAGSDAAVRVRRVNPPEPERALLRTGERAPERMETPPGLRAALRRKLGNAAPGTDEPPSTTLSSGPMPTMPAPPAIQPKPLITPPTAKRPQPPRPATPPPVVAKAELAPKPTAPAPKPATPKPAPPRPVQAAPAPEPAAPVHHAALVVQVAAFGDRARAEKAAHAVGGKVEAAGKLYRVRIIASDDAAAKAALAKARQAGYAGAILLHHD